MAITDRLIGLHHFLGDRAPGNIPLVPPKPHKQNPWLKDGKAIVVKIAADNDIRQSVDRALTVLGPLSAAIPRGDKVLLKPNFNSDDPYPASTDLAFLQAMLELLIETGAKVTIGESAGGLWRPTVNVFRRLNLCELARKFEVELIAFDDGPDDWVRIPIEGEYLSGVTMPRSAYEADRLIYLPCLKTHQLAAFSGSLKLAFGFVHPGERRGFHLGNLQEKLAEVNMCWQPDLIVMDGRKAFVTGGPNKGKVVEPGVIIASGDLIATDVEAIKMLLSYHARNRLTSNPWQLPQIATAVKHGLGAGEDEYTLVTSSLP